MLKTSDYTRGTLRQTDQQIWDEYYMSKPTDTTSWQPEEIISDSEEEYYENLFRDICGATLLITFIFTVWVIWTYL